MKEPEDVFFSKEQIEQSIKKLDKLHPFFGTVFLAFKKAELPIGKTTAINFKQVVNDILQAYYPLYRPTSDIEDHRIYTPFRMQNKKNQNNHWNKEPYTDSLDQIAMNTDAVDHPGGSQWAWNEHIVTTRLMRKNLQHSIILLIDEIEAHLHPYWQRTIVPALLNVVQSLAKEVQIQILITTHSPLVLASLETVFDKNVDNLFHLHIQNDLVKLDELPFIKRGRVDQWLTSDVFGLVQPRSIDAEKAIGVANKLQLTKNPPQEEVQKVSDKLVKVLAPDDEYWPLWTYFAKQKGVHYV